MLKKISIVQCLLLFCGGVKSEPTCTSRFDFEDKMLQKMVRIEFEVEQLSESLAKMTEDFEAVGSQIVNIQLQCDTLKEANSVIQQAQADLKKTQNHLIENIQDVRKNTTLEITAFKDEFKTPVGSTVLFRARSPVIKTYEREDTVIYSSTEVNEGQGYSTTTGMFTAPVRGVYHFSVNLCYANKDAMYFGIMKEGNTIIGTSANNIGSHNTCHSILAHALLEIGEKVWVKCLGQGALRDTYPYFWNTFSGSLVHGS